MANKYDIMAWQDELAKVRARKALALKRLELWQSRGDDVRCDETYAMISRYNNLIDALNYEIRLALVPTPQELGYTNSPFLEAAE